MSDERNPFRRSTCNSKGSPRTITLVAISSNTCTPSSVSVYLGKLVMCCLSFALDKALLKKFSNSCKSEKWNQMYSNQCNQAKKKLSHHFIQENLLKKANSRSFVVVCHFSYSDIRRYQYLLILISCQSFFQTIGTEDRYKRQPQKCFIQENINVNLLATSKTSIQSCSYIFSKILSI